MWKRKDYSRFYRRVEKRPGAESLKAPQGGGRGRKKLQKRAVHRDTRETKNPKEEKIRGGATGGLHMKIPRQK